MIFLSIERLMLFNADFIPNRSLENECNTIPNDRFGFMLTDKKMNSYNIIRS
ncbi:hypothetical protein JN06_02082 [Bacteroides zoogleoformans]|nr:hypothetical protein JN06_02082 [Bacteroides zoogleoformans]